MDLKKILITGAFLLAGTGLFAQEIPKVNQEDLKFITYGRDRNGQLCMSMGYDTNQDDWEDTIFHYLRTRVSSYQETVYLDSFAVDENRDHNFAEDEWVQVKPPKDNKISDNSKKEI